MAGGQPLKIHLGCPLSGRLSLRVYNSAGEWIETLEDRELTSSWDHWYQWNGTNHNHEWVASGIYLLRLASPTGVSIAKVVVIR
jgi:flagellar hook assembly protein FlgD